MPHCGASGTAADGPAPRLFIVFFLLLLGVGAGVLVLGVLIALEHGATP
jgi:hypothetical protein